MERMFMDEYLQAWAEENPEEAKDMKHRMARQVAYWRSGDTAPVDPPGSQKDDLPYTPTMPPPGMDYYRPTAGSKLTPIAKASPAGVFPVTEVNSTSIASNTSNLASVQQTANRRPMLGGYGTPLAQHASLIVRVVVAADGAGAFVATNVLAALAGYYGVVRLKSVKADAIVPAGVLIFESPAATPALPSVEVMPALAANARRTDIECVITHTALTDNQAVTVRGTSWGALTNLEIEFEAWYET
jgi:hypothetical protein